MIAHINIIQDDKQYVSFQSQRATENQVGMGHTKIHLSLKKNTLQVEHNENEI